MVEEAEPEVPLPLSVSHLHVRKRLPLRDHALSWTDIVAGALRSPVDSTVRSSTPYRLWSHGKSVRFSNQFS